LKEGDFFCQKINMKTFLMKLKGIFISKPKQKLSWTCEDYLKGKKWSMTQPHPFKKDKTLWDFVHDKSESLNTIDNINKFLFNEI
jgi:hypothetical protein